MKKVKSLKLALRQALNIPAIIRSVSWLGLLNKLLFQWFCSTNKMSRERNYTLHSLI